MKTVLGIILVGILTLALGWYLPWWSIGIAGFAGGMFLGNKSWQSFLMAFLGTGLCWMILSFVIDQSNSGILSSKMSVLFGGLSPILLILITALVGGLASGLAGLTGYFAKKTFTAA